ncbi:type IV pilus biogenesis protein PilM [Robertmurraya andreesenii]|uniref:Type IV pilus assembly protein PilM n=1 Tax=Anoxybacillus andreesenii TaxID=1325932 RepID=A0ABT9V5C3_9BACL|nr:pilus assembly protein PilM [Robertmurraya andreesenii]MDQ0156122.1 type IV pilus assembly protein PilM [Robertmurraya andreesenii]
MNLSLFSRKDRVVNIIINDHSIRYLELKQAKPPIPYKWGERLLPTGLITNGKINDFETLANILEECVNDWKLRNRQVRFLIPESFVIVRKVSIPAEVKDDEIKGYLYLELGTSIHLPFDEPVFDAVVLSKDKEKKEILIFAAQEDNVIEYSNLLSEAKLEPVAAEVSPLAIYRLYHHLQQAGKEEDLLIVQFGLNDVNICIFENTIPFFMHHLPLEFDEKQWDKKLNRNGNYDLVYIGEQSSLSFQLEDTYKEINRLMDFYRYSLHQGKKQVSKILLDGDHPMLAQIKKDLEGRFDVPLETIAYQEQVSLEQDFSYKYYLALGLALKGV